MYIDRSRLVRLLLAGVFAGLVIYFIFNPGMVAYEEKHSFQIDFGDPEGSLRALKEIQDEESGTSTLVLMAVFSGAFAAMLGGTLTLADEVFSPPKRIALRMGVAVVVGLVVGGLSGLIAQVLFASMLNVSFLLLLPARIIGWATFGLGAGAGLGVALGSSRRALMCMLGGFIGGCLGGGLFDIIGAITMFVTQTGSASRFVGFTVMGIAVGVTVAFVEDMAKRSWVTVLSGPKEGRSFILSKPETTIGRDELADIPLFGDPRVAKRHASLLMQGYMVTLQGTGGSVAVNGAQMPSAMLRPWDVITVGRWSLRFHQKGQRHAAPAGFYAQPYAHPTPQPFYVPPNQTMVQPAVRAATGSLALAATSGPHLNQRFQFGPGTVRIGREAGCAILLSQDTVVSRNHAELSWNGSGWVVRDLGSRNGLWVNGVRVTEHTLTVGDQIGVGQTWLRVEGL